MEGFGSSADDGCERNQFQEEAGGSTIDVNMPRMNNCRQCQHPLNQHEQNVSIQCMFLSSFTHLL